MWRQIEVVAPHLEEATVQGICIEVTVALSRYLGTLRGVEATRIGDEEEHHLAIIAKNQAQAALESQIAAVQNLGASVSMDRLTTEQLLESGVFCPWCAT